MSDWKDIATTVGRIAGTVAPLLSGPVGVAATIGAQIAGALGTDNRPDAVQRELVQNPGAALKLQQWAHEEREQIRQANLKLVELHLKETDLFLDDVKNARTQHHDSPMPARLTLSLAIMVVALTVALMVMPVPDSSKEVVFYLAGQIVTAFLAAVTYWLGSSRGSAEKQKQIDRIAGGHIGPGNRVAGRGDLDGSAAGRRADARPQ
ncbi:hypothetical protein [Oceanisphaera arctica]|uniref:Holin of 3TMs, for gene-transfer release n=1 Tax=Oceanisphaera arctica TaxID=641510 RepID=A0A2P5TMX6_9GAMM|nr:hypothetical protein [Oceanisphaera arctica]PPL16810.1 hypothetical protein UN63_07770 [Oceanisphaera arctica]GHA05581.1 hypothetical protein GCM10007082_03180 [Oceanisphaera arctica]